MSLSLLVSLGSSLIIFSSFLFFRSLVKKNKSKSITDNWYLWCGIFLFSYFFRILTWENIAKILTTGPRLLLVGTTVAATWLSSAGQMLKVITTLRLNKKWPSNQALCVYNNENPTCTINGWKFSGLFLNSGFWGWLSIESQPQNTELGRLY